MSGGRFPIRLADKCEGFRGQDFADEWEMFRHWIRFGRTSQGIVNLVCLNPRAVITSSCLPDSDVEPGASYFANEEYKKYRLKYT